MRIDHSAYSDKIPKALNTYETGWSATYGPLQLNKEGIIEFARIVDPQPLHTDEASAKTSRFGGLIASALHPYSEFHKRFWIPLTAETFICGLSFDHAMFTQPVYAEQPVYARVTIVEAKVKHDKDVVIVKWEWWILNEKLEMIHTLRNSTLHKLVK